MYSSSPCLHVSSVTTIALTTVVNNLLSVPLQYLATKTCLATSGSYDTSEPVEAVRTRGRTKQEFLPAGASDDRRPMQALSSICLLYSELCRWPGPHFTRRPIVALLAINTRILASRQKGSFFYHPRRSPIQLSQSFRKLPFSGQMTRTDFRAANHGRMRLDKLVCLGV